MEDFRYEEAIGKAYDSRLMKRLLVYAKPYWKWIVISILLLLAITLIDLASPYITKMAIDNHITAFNKPMIAQTISPANQKNGIIFEGKQFVRIQEGQAVPQGEKYQLLNIENEYYLIQGWIKQTNTPIAIRKDSDAYYAVSNTEKYPARKLTREELKSFRQKDVQSVLKLALLYLGVVALGFALNYVQMILLQYTGQKIIFDIRQVIFSHLQKMSLSFYDKNPVGRLVTRVTNDTETLNEMYTGILVNLFKDIFLLVGIVVVMFSIHVQLSLVIMGVIPVIVVATVIFRLNARDAYRNVRTKLARINAFLSEHISGMKIIQIFHQEKRKEKEFDQANQELYQASLREMWVYSIFRPFIEGLFSLCVALIIWFGASKYLQVTLQFGVLYAFVNYVEMFFRPINDLTEKYNILQSAMASSERIFQLLDTEESINNPDLPLPLENIKGKIEFDHVWFAYNEEDWVLRDVSFSIEPGETVAFVGATGAGKTSIISLLSRFYDIQKGQIKIDGVDIKSVKKEDLRRNIGVVLQDVFLFTGDIKSNIRLNNTEIPDERIKEVARYVNAHHFIEKLPGQYEEPVQERGSTLSAGQRQLLAFARALVFDPAILVLDEATSNIDTETELLIQDALQKMIKGRTTIVIAHRLSTIQHADKIIVLHKGRIREMGKHQELLNKKGLYYRLYQLQYKKDS